MSKLISLLTAGVLAQNLGPEAFGDWSKLLMVILIIITVSCLGAPVGFQRILPAMNTGRTKGILLYSTMSSILISIFFILLFVINFDAYVPLWIMLTGVMAYLLDTIIDNYLRARIDEKKLSGYILIRSILDITIIFFVLSLGLKPGQSMITIAAGIFLFKLSLSALYIAKELRDSSSYRGRNARYYLKKLTLSLFFP